MDVRLAKYTDLTAMVLFMRDQHAKSVFKDVLFNAALSRKNVTNMIKTGHGDILLAVNKEGKIRGMLFAWQEELIWTHRKIATDLHFIAEQGGDMLLRAFKKWAKEKGCAELCTGTFNQKNEDRIEKLYNRMGLETVGRTYRMELS